jgi:glycosyltransferase involved in cell wall biosynthesis
MVKILQVYRTYFPDTQGGTEEVIRQLVKGIVRKGGECKILVPSKHTKDVEVIVVDGIEVIRVPEVIEIASCNMFVKGFSEFSDLVLWADVVHYHYPWPLQDVMHASLPSKLRAERKFIVTYHSDIIKQKFLLKLYTPLMRWFFGQMDLIVASSINYAQTSSTLRSYMKKVEVVPFGLDDEALPALCQSNRSKWESKVGKDFFFFVGVLRYYKGLHILLEAARQQNFKVVIAGAGNQRRLLEKMIDQYNLSNVILVGRVSDEDKVSLFHLSKAVVLPSFIRSEAFGIVLLEGLYMGKPLVTADIGSGMSFVNENGKTGLWVEPGSVSSLRAALNQLSENPMLCEEFSCNARKRFESEFTNELMSSRYMDLYRSVLS